MKVTTVESGVRTGVLHEATAMVQMAATAALKCAVMIARPRGPISRLLPCPRLERIEHKHRAARKHGQEHHARFPGPSSETERVQRVRSISEICRSPSSRSTIPKRSGRPHISCTHALYEPTVAAIPIGPSSSSGPPLEGSAFKRSGIAYRI